jgi:hypothetical protein
LQGTGGWQAAAVGVSALLVLLLGIDHGHIADAAHEAESSLRAFPEMEQTSLDPGEAKLPT